MAQAHACPRGFLLAHAGICLVQRPPAKMVVAARLGWIRQQVAQGAPAFISFGAASDSTRSKCKVIVEPGGPATSACARLLLLDALSALDRRTSLSVTMDRGHKHSDGKSEISFWLSESPLQPSSHGWSDAPPPDDGPDGNDGSSGNGGYRRRRGRSPPGPSDPWQSPGADPWCSSASSVLSPARKAPRQQAAASGWSWRSWRCPSTTVSHSCATSSVTPEPPMTQHRKPASYQSSRTGAPPLLHAVGSDGLFVSNGVWTPLVSVDSWMTRLDEDPLSALAGMACFVPVSGATVECGDDVDVFEGQSLVNIALERLDSSRSIVQKIIKECEDSRRLQNAKREMVIHVGAWGLSMSKAKEISSSISGVDVIAHKGDKLKLMVDSDLNATFICDELTKDLKEGKHFVHIVHSCHFDI